MPARIELSKTELRQLAKDYKTMGLSELAEAWQLSINTVRRLLDEAGAEIRPRGRRPA